MGGEQLVEMPEVGGGDIARARHRPQVIPLSKLVPEILRHRDMRGEIGFVDGARLAAMLEQAGHQRDVAAGTDREVEVGFLGGFGAARVDDDELGARLAARADTLIDDRVAPGGVRSDEYDQVGGVEVVVGRGDDILAKGARVSGDRARHAKPRIGVDVRGADEALHQLVRDVIILGEELPRDVESDAAGAVARDRFLKFLGDEIERLIPARTLGADHRVEQAAFEPDGFAEVRALRAETAAVRGVVGIARDLDAALAGHRRADAAADAAIGTGGADLH